MLHYQERPLPSGDGVIWKARLKLQHTHKRMWVSVEAGFCEAMTSSVLLREKWLVWRCLGGRALPLLLLAAYWRRRRYQNTAQLFRCSFEDHQVGSIRNKKVVAFKAAGESSSQETKVYLLYSCTEVCEQISAFGDAVCTWKNNSFIITEGNSFTSGIVYSHLFFSLTLLLQKAAGCFLVFFCMFLKLGRF